jgi:hypothetical protein
MPSQKGAHERHDLLALVLQGEVAAVEEVQFDLLEISDKSHGAARRKTFVVGTPNDQHRRLVRTKEGLELRIERDIGAIIVEQIELDLGIPWPVQQRLIVDPSRWVDAGDVTDAVDVLELCGFR